MKNLLNRFRKDESGATAIEYGLIAAMMAVIIIAVWGTMGDGLNAKITEIVGLLNTDATYTAPTTSTTP